MNVLLRHLVAGLVGVVVLHATDDPLDRVEDALSWHSGSGAWRAKISGLLDAESYALPHPAPGVIDADGHWLFNPRLTVYFDSQIGNSLYVFAQGRADRGFDPSTENMQARLDEAAIRWEHPNARFDIQLGKFATVVGNWTSRHASWSNPFITAPLPYEHLTAVWDNEPPRSSGQLLVWSHLRPGLPQSAIDEEKYLRLPIVWGPSYATGLAIAGAVDKLRYAIEVKSGSLSSRPEAWAPPETRWDYPTVSGRVRYAPNEQWELGFSASSGVFLRPVADPAIPPPLGRGDYRERVLGQDVTFAWHHLQVWAELYEARFELPLVGHADTVAGYIETKYKFTPQFSGAIRWNRQIFGTISDRGRDVQWERNVWRVDIAPAYRVTPHLQLKLQGSLERGNTDDGRVDALGAVQATLRF